MVNLPNSYKVRVIHSGLLCALPNLILHKVLCIPPFMLNLLFVYKLCRQLNKYVLFTPKYCFMFQVPSLQSGKLVENKEDSTYSNQAIQMLFQGNQRRSLLVLVHVLIQFLASIFPILVQFLVHVLLCLIPI